MTNKVTCWTEEVTKLAEFALSQPQAITNPCHEANHEDQSSVKVTMPDDQLAK